MAETLVLTIPRMYADHHVQKVRDVVLALKGIENIRASAMDMQVEVTYRPGEIAPTDIKEALAKAGYEEGAVQSVLEMIAADGSAWRHGSLRTTRTNEADTKMAGDFRKY
ncbi:MAG: heavy-metal-associated domain-containing protein [Anaerolineae bacterium]